MDRAAAVGWPPDPGLRDRSPRSAEARRHGAGDRAGGGPVAHARAGRPHRRPLRPAPDARRRTPRRRPAPVGAGGAGLEPRPAGAGADRALLRRVSVFVAPFTAESAAEVAGFAPLEPAAVADGLARLAEQSLLRGGVRGRHPVPGAGDHPPVRDRAAHRGRRAGRGALPAPGLVPGQRGRPDAEAYATDWRARFDAVADDLRAALAGRPTARAARGGAYRSPWPWPS